MLDGVCYDIYMARNLVIVESPAKAKTIEKYLGKDFKVLASVGHIRKDTKVDKTTFEVTYEIDTEHKSIINELKKENRRIEKKLKKIKKENDLIKSTKGFKFMKKIS